MSIVFTPAQLQTLDGLTNGGNGNFAVGYAFLHGELTALSASEIAAMGSTAEEIASATYWLARATEINSNDLTSQANQFIRDVTRYGLMWDGLPSGAIQSNSDRIGVAVIKHILLNDEMLPIEEIVGLDVQAAILDGGQTVAGWGGAFYYWDAPYTMPGSGTPTTIGGYILSTAGEFEKFVAVTAMAAYNALGDTLDASATIDIVLGELANMFGTQWNSAIPFEYKREIGLAVLDFALGAGPLFTAIDISNAYAYRSTSAGLNGATIDFSTGDVFGFVSHEEDFKFVPSAINSVTATEHGDRVVLVDQPGVVPLVAQGLGGDDRFELHGGYVDADGGSDFDTVVIDGAWANFNFLALSSGYQLTSKTGPSRTYVLSDFEAFVFTDGTRTEEQLLPAAPTDIIWSAGGGHVAENSPIGTIVGSLQTVDPNGEQPFTYSFTTGSAFSIDSATGVITTAVVFDFESLQSANITVKVTDSDGLSFTKTLNIAIDDISPIINSPAGGYVSGTSAITNGTDENDRMYGTSFGDYFIGSKGDDKAFGYGGDDIFQDPNPSQGNDTYDGGSGTDTVSYLGTGHIVVDLTAGTATGGYAGNDTLISIENASTWKGNDKLTGTSGANVLKGGEGNDQIWGLAGNDILMGGWDTDTLYGGAGNDYLYGNSDTSSDSAFNDTAVFSGSVNQYDFALFASNNAWLSVNGPDGFDWTHSVEIFKFDDATLTRQQIELGWL